MQNKFIMDIVIVLFFSGILGYILGVVSDKLDERAKQKAQAKNKETIE